MKTNDTFYSYSIRLSAFLILNNQRPYKVITDRDGKFIFLFDNKPVCDRLLQKYKIYKGGR